MLRKVGEEEEIVKGNDEESEGKQKLHREVGRDTNTPVTRQERDKLPNSSVDEQEYGNNICKALILWADRKKRWENRHY